MKRKRYLSDLKYKNCTIENGGKALFCDESRFFIHGRQSQDVRRSSGEKIPDCHVNQHFKHPQKKTFSDCFGYNSVHYLQPVDRITRSQLYIEVLNKRIVP